MLFTFGERLCIKIPDTENGNYIIEVCFCDKVNLFNVVLKILLLL